MAENEPSNAVLDAGPIIHLDELDCLDLLEGFGELRIPRIVWHEVLRHRPNVTERAALGFQMQGTFGILVRAIRRKTRSVSEVKALIASIPHRSSLHLNSNLLQHILENLLE